MRSKIISVANPPSASLQTYHPLHVTTGAWQTVETNEFQIVAAPGTYSGFRVNLTAAPGVGKSRTFTLRKNGSDTALTVTVSDNATTGSISTPLAVVAGDLVTVTTIPTNTPAAASASWSLDFQGSQPNVSQLLSNCTIAATAIVYLPVQGQLASSASAPGNETLVSVNGVISNLTVRLDSPLASGTRTFTLRKNGVNTGLSVSFSSGQQQLSDNVNSVTVAPGDRIVIAAGGSSVAAVVSSGLLFTATTDGEATHSCGTPNSPSTSATNFAVVGGVAANSWTAVESDVQAVVNAVTLRRLDVRLTNSPGTGKSWTFNVHVNGSNVGLQTVISDANTTGTISLDVPVAAGALLSLQVVPSGTPASTGRIEWAITTYQLNAGRAFAVFPA
jgi:hypothetical protein